MLIEDSNGGELPLIIRPAGRLDREFGHKIGCAASSATGGNRRHRAHSVRRSGAVFEAGIETRAAGSRSAVLGATLLEVIVPSTDTQLRIWANAATEAHRLTIGIARPGSGIAR